MNPSLSFCQDLEQIQYNSWASDNSEIKNNALSK